MGLVVLIDRPGYRLAADRKIIKRNEASVVAEAAEAYALAQNRIGAMLSGVRELQAKRLDEGYREGFAIAQRDAAQRLITAEMGRLELLKSLQPALVEVIVDAVALLVKGLEREQFVARALETLQSALRDASWARLRVHPDAAPAARNALLEFDRETGLGKLAHVVADESLPADGCVLESEFGAVDASLDTQLEAIRDAIANAAAHELAAAVEGAGDGR